MGRVCAGASTAFVPRRGRAGTEPGAANLRRADRGLGTSAGLRPVGRACRGRSSATATARVVGGSRHSSSISERLVSTRGSCGRATAWPPPSRWRAMGDRRAAAGGRATWPPAPRSSASSPLAERWTPFAARVAGSRRSTDLRATQPATSNWHGRQRPTPRPEWPRCYSSSLAGSFDGSGGTPRPRRCSSLPFAKPSGRGGWLPFGTRGVVAAFVTRSRRPWRSWISALR